MTLLQQRDQARRQRRLDVFAEVRDRLRAALRDLVPGHEVIVFGSLTRPGVFHDRSDVDLALPPAAADLDPIHLTATLSDRLRRPVDVVRLDHCRFRDKILCEGERWTL